MAEQPPPTQRFHSQFGQDEILDRALFGQLRNGVFVDIGAHNGVSLSNTFHLERDLGWHGLCIEANPRVFPALSRNRSAVCLNLAIADREGSMPFYAVTGYGEMLSGLSSAIEGHLDFLQREVAGRGSVDVIEVTARRLDSVLLEHDYSEVHYLSIDTEGNEAEILGSLDQTRVMIHVVSAEGHRRREVKRLAEALGPSFARVVVHFSDTFFVNRGSPFFSCRWALVAESARYRARRHLRRLVGRR